MSGIINAAPPAGGAQAALHNPLLAQAEAKIKAGLTQQNHVNYMKIVVAGLDILLNKGINGFMAKLRYSKDPVADCAKGAAALVQIMQRMAHGIMAMKAAVPAGMTLVLHGLDFIDQSGIAKIAEPELERATRIYANTMFARQKITPGMLQSATARVHQIIQDPDAMEKLNLKAGFTRHPMAATPTPLPGGPLPGGPPQPVAA